ncbi:collagen-binding domain-containing protein [Dyadobacter psychrotolerans]|nr:collagen-binding domain-containing protein [Dyadobacter psychrotolerans]
MKKSLNLRLINFAGAVAVGLMAISSFNVKAQCTATNALTIPSQFLGSGFNGDGNFNAVVLGSYNTGDGGTDGRLAVGGNFTLNSSLVGYKAGLTALSPVGGDNFIVNGLLTNTTGKDIVVRGNSYYGSLQSASPAPIHSPGEGANFNQTNRINFSGLQQHYISLSNDYENQAASNAPDPIISDGNIVLTGDNTIKNYVFNVSVDGDAISGVQFVNIPAGSGILINVLNTNVVIASTETSVPMSDVHKATTLFNFPNATSILLSDYNVQGGILAPLANLFVQTGEINGPAVIGGNITQSTGFSFHSSCLSYPLPVRLVSFDAKKEGGQANLKWQTSSEKNAEKFIIQRNTGNKWQVIGQVKAKGESIEKLTYDFSDSSPLNGENLYRLKMIDKDETFAYSSIVRLDFKNTVSIVIFPNPVVDQISFVNVDWVKVTDLHISNVSGKLVPFQINAEKKIDVKNWQTGLYMIHFTSADGSIHTHKVVKY